MSKPKVYGSFRSFLPNSRADSRRRKLWEHNRQIAERDVIAIRQEKDQKRLEQEKEREKANACRGEGA